ncbi:MAG TPA: hypothetical protein VFE90_16445 [Myxococcales bacterium]|nr:hypothetical protein [Myxococcales bacterium]
MVAALSLALAACTADGSSVPCADDSSCPHDFPVCTGASASAPGKCSAGTSTNSASIAVVGVDGHSPADFVSGTVRVQVTARANTGVQSVTLTAGTVTFPASATVAPAPLFAFDVDTTKLTNADAQLTATLKPGSGASVTATGTLHVDNAKPTISSFTVGGGTSASITAGTTIALSASFSSGAGVVTATPGGGTVAIASGGSILVSPDVATTYNLRVVGHSGVVAQTGTAGQPPDPSLSVVAPASFTGTFSVTPTAVQQSNSAPGTNFTFTAPTFGASVTSAVLKDPSGVTVPGLTITSGGTFDVPIPAITVGTTSLTYTLVLSNSATTPNSASLPVVVSVGTPPTIASFTGPATPITVGGSAALHATFAGGNGVITPGGIPINSGGTVLVTPGANTTYKLTVTNPATSGSVASGDVAHPDVTVSVIAAPAITSFSASTQHTSSAVGGLTFTINTTGTTGNATVTGTCTNGATVTTPFSITLAGGIGTSAAQTAAAVGGTSVCTYTATVSNAAGTSAQQSTAVTVEPLPTIGSFTFQVASPFNPGDNVVLNHTYNAQGGTASINGVAAGASGGSTTFNNIQASTAYTLTVTNLAGASTTQTLNATVKAVIDDFSVGAAQASAADAVTISNGGTTSLFAAFRGSGAAGNANGSIACAPACNGTLSAITIASGGTPVTVTGITNGTFTYTLTVTPSSGAPATRAVVVTVVPASTATSLTAGSNVIPAGTSTTLTPVFSFNGAVPGTATITGNDGSSFTGLISGTPLAIAPSVTTIYTLKVANAAGLAAATAPTATVTVTTGTWASFNTVEPSLRIGATVTPLTNGKVLVAGGHNGTGGAPTNSVLVCTTAGLCAVPAGATKVMGSGRAFHTATVLTAGVHTGQVLLAGGFIDAALTNATTTADFYDPATDNLTPTTALSSSRARHIATLLGDGSTVLVAGGTADGTNGLNTAFKYAAGIATPTITALGSMNQSRLGATATLLGSTATSSVLVVGGVTGIRTNELFDPTSGANGAFTLTGAGTMPAGEDKRFHTATLIGTGANAGKVLISGGTTGAAAGTPTATQFLWSTGGTVTAAPSLRTPRSNHAAATLSNNNVLLCGGSSTGSNTIASCDVYDPSAGTGSVVPTASMLVPRKDFGIAPITIATIPEVFAAGGTTAATGFGSPFAEVFNPN